jgi:hypothetical protein
MESKLGDEFVDLVRKWERFEELLDFGKKSKVSFFSSNRGQLINLLIVISGNISSPGKPS